MNQEVTAEDLTTYNSTKKKVFAMIPFDQISTSGLMTPSAISIVQRFGATLISNNNFFTLIGVIGEDLTNEIGRDFIKFCMGEIVAPQSATILSNFDKLKLWLEHVPNLDNDKYITKKQQISSNFFRTLNKCTPTEIDEQEPQLQVGKLLSLIAYTEEVVDLMRLPEKYIIFIVSQRQVTAQLLEVVKTQIDDDINPFSIDTTLTTSASLGEVLYELGMARKQSVTLILKNPLNMLYDRLFELLKGNSYKDGVYTLINAIFKTRNDPTEQVIKILEGSKNCAYVWQFYQDNPNKL